MVVVVATGAGAEEQPSVVARWAPGQNHERESEMMLMRGNAKELGWRVACAAPPRFRLLSFVDSNQRVLGIFDDGKVRLWDAADGKELQHAISQPLFPKEAASIRLSSDGTALAWMDKKGAVTLVDLKPPAAQKGMK